MKKICLFFILISTSILAQQQIKVDLSNPNATILTHWYFLQENTYKPENAAKTIYGFDGEEAIEIAKKLREIIVGKGLKIDFNKISASWDLFCQLPILEFSTIFFLLQLRYF